MGSSRIFSLTRKRVFALTAMVTLLALGLPVPSVHADTPPVAGWSSQPSQASPSDTWVRVDTYVNDSASNPVSYTVEYSLNGGAIWANAGHLSGGSFPISGNTITGITTYGDGPSNRSNVTFHWDYAQDESSASTTNAEIRVTPHDVNGDGDPIVSDPFTLKAPPSPPIFAGDSGAISDITENSVIVHYDMSSTGSTPLHHFELDYADDTYYTANNSYAQHTPITFTGSFASSGATDVTGLSCATTYHFVQAFTNEDGQVATSSDATFTTSDCTGGGGGGGGAPFTSGTGTDDDPYIIDDCAQLPTVNDHLGASFLLEANLDCRELGTDVIIGSLNDHVPFTGTFDGGGHSIAIDMEAPVTGLGLFSFMVGAAVRDLAIAPDSFIEGVDVDGSIAGAAINSTFTRVGSAATVVSVGTTPTYPLTGTGGIVGGLYGGSVLGAEFTGIAAGPLVVGGIAGLTANDLQDGAGAIISRSDSEAQIVGAVGLGGIAGYMIEGSQIRNSYSSSTVSYDPEFSAPVTGALGGLAGLMLSGTISRSYAAGTVSVGSSSDLYPSGGLVGMIASVDTVIVHSFSAAQVTSTGAALAGLIGGVDESDGAFTGLYDDYFDTERTGQTLCISADTESRADCTGVDGSADGFWIDTARAPLSYWNDDVVWDFSDEAGGFPLLRAYAGPEPEESDAREESGGGGDTPAPSTRRHVIRHGASVPLSFLGSASTATSEQQLASLEAQYETLLAKLHAQAGTAATLSASRDLELGATGDDVAALQAFLIAHGYAIPAGATGYFGPQTRAALAAYQKAHGIAPSVGYYGPITRASIAGQ